MNQVSLQRVRFLEQNFGFRSKSLTEVDNMNFSHRFSILSKAVTTYNGVIQKIIAIAVRTKIFVLKFKKNCFSHCAVRIVSQSGLYICKNWLPLKLLQKLELSLLHIYLTNLEKIVMLMKLFKKV